MITYVERTTDFCVSPLYVICEGDEGNFQAPETEKNTPESACERIRTGVKLLQCLYAEKLNELGFGRKTFQLKETEPTVFKSTLTVEKVGELSKKDLWFFLAREIITSDLGRDPGTKFLAFLSCTRYESGGGEESYEERIKRTKGYAAYGGDGLALLGTACLYTWAKNVDDIAQKLEDSTMVDRRKFLDDSGNR